MASLILTIIIILCPAFLLVATMAYDYENNSTEQQELIELFMDAERKADNASDSESITRIKNAISEFESVYSLTNSALDNDHRKMYRFVMDELEEQLKCLEDEKYEAKASKYLSTFIDCYNIISSGAIDNFKQSEELFNLKRKCLSAWNSYFSINLEEYSTPIYPDQYFKEYLGCWYEPFMSSYTELEKKLMSYINVIRPEHNRKMRLYKILLDRISENQNIMRCKLLKEPIEGYTLNEMKYCYNELLRNNRIFEYKMGSRIFAQLSDSEQLKRHPVQNDEAHGA